MIVINLNFLKKYDIALSFAEENRTFVDVVAQLLKEKGIKIYYDDDERIESWGKDLKKYMDKVYRVQAKFCIVFVSRDYERKRWTNFEIGRARARLFFTKNNGYVLPYLLDESEYAEQFMDIGCLTRRTHDEHRLAKAIEQKLDQQPERRLAYWFKRQYKNKLRLATLIMLLAGSTAFNLRDHFTPVDILSERLYEQSQHQIEGSTCKDGWFSHHRGPGTCSGHSGVAGPKDTVIFDKTLEQCRKEAEKISWLP